MRDLQIHLEAQEEHLVLQLLVLQSIKLTEEMVEPEVRLHNQQLLETLVLSLLLQKHLLILQLIKLEEMDIQSLVLVMVEQKNR